MANHKTERSHIVPTRILFLCRKRSRLLDFLRLLLQQSNWTTAQKSAPRIPPPGKPIEPRCRQSIQRRSNGHRDRTLSISRSHWLVSNTYIFCRRRRRRRRRRHFTGGHNIIVACRSLVYTLIPPLAAIVTFRYIFRREGRVHRPGRRDAQIQGKVRE
jgi:hypothetical protein